MADAINVALKPNAGSRFRAVLPSMSLRSRKDALPDFPHQAGHYQADSVASLHDRVRDAVRCHFDEGQVPKVIRLHFVREEIITA